MREWRWFCWEQIGSNDSNPFDRMQEGGVDVARGMPTWTCTGEDQIEARGAPANHTDMNVIRTIPSRRSGKDYQKPRRLAFESRMRLIRSWVPDLEIIRQTGKGLIAHGSGSRTCMGERINNVHGSLIPCHLFLCIKKGNVRESVQSFTNNYCLLANSCLKNVSNKNITIVKGKEMI